MIIFHMYFICMALIHYYNFSYWPLWNPEGWLWFDWWIVLSSWLTYLFINDCSIACPKYLPSHLSVINSSFRLHEWNPLNLKIKSQKNPWGFGVEALLGEFFEADVLWSVVRRFWFRAHTHKLCCYDRTNFDRKFWCLLTFLIEILRQRCNYFLWQDCFAWIARD